MSRRRPRILCHVNHFFGASEFVGKSTVGDAEERRAVVERVVGAVRDLPFDVDVRVYGVPGASLLDVDAGPATDIDPRHLVYESIAAMAAQPGRYDWYLNIEDDVLVNEGQMRASMEFAQNSRIHEVLHPNRFEKRPDGSSVLVDLEAMPGWRGMSRKWGSHRLDVALNPHSGIMFLSADQLDYARERVDLSRRELIVGGFMASAYANIHLPFLLWRTREDLSAHRVDHLDTWLGPAPTTTDRGPAPAPVAPPAYPRARGRVEHAALDGAFLVASGWVKPRQGRRQLPVALLLDDEVVPVSDVVPVLRPDVVEARPKITDPDCGFELELSLLDVPEAVLRARSAWVLVGDQDDPESDERRVLPFPGEGAWLGAEAIHAVRSVPEVPDVPHLPEASLGRLTELLEGARAYLEYGAGGSTLLAARVGVPHVVAVESDGTWLEAVRHKLRDASWHSELDLRRVRLGPTGPRGFPVDDRGWRSYAAYALSPWEAAEASGRADSVDLVLVGGTFRRACLLASMLHARPGTRVLFDDYLSEGREHYATVESLVRPVAVHDRMAEFVVPESLDREQVWRDLMEAVTDSR